METGGKMFVGYLQIYHHHHDTWAFSPRIIKREISAHVSYHHDEDDKCKKNTMINITINDKHTYQC